MISITVEPGWPLSGEVVSEQVPALSAAGYRVITNDRRGFGHSAKSKSGYDDDTLTGDLRTLLETLDLQDVTLVGFSMGGGEVARYFTLHGADRIRSVMFASAVPPFLMQGDNNPTGPLTKDMAATMTAGLTKDETTFHDGTTQFFSINGNGELKVTEAQRQQALTLCLQAVKKAALGCMEAFATTDFRGDLPNVPALVLQAIATGLCRSRAPGSAPTTPCPTARSMSSPAHARRERQPPP